MTLLRLEEVTVPQPSPWPLCSVSSVEISTHPLPPFLLCTPLQPQLLLLLLPRTGVNEQNCCLPGVVSSGSPSTGGMASVLWLIHKEWSHSTPLHGVVMLLLLLRVGKHENYLSRALGVEPALQQLPRPAHTAHYPLYPPIPTTAVAHIKLVAQGPRKLFIHPAHCCHNQHLQTPV